VKYILCFIFLLIGSSAISQILKYSEVKTIYQDMGTTNPVSMLMSKDFTLIEKKSTMNVQRQNTKETWTYKYDKEIQRAEIYVSLDYQKIIVDGKSTGVSYKKLSLEFDENSSSYNYLF
jgi:hypothetical protein